MAFGDTCTATTFAGWCTHGTPYGQPCFYCQHPALGPAAPQTFQLGGWVCAGCGHGYAPSLTECPRCPQQKPADDGKPWTFGNPPHWDDRDVTPIPPGPVSCTGHTEGGLCACGEDTDDDEKGCTGGRRCSC